MWQWWGKTDTISWNLSNLHECIEHQIYRFFKIARYVAAEKLRGMSQLKSIRDWYLIYLYIKVLVCIREK